jgi:hypothetical protein
VAHALYACPRKNKLKWEKDSYIQVWKNLSHFALNVHYLKKLGLLIALKEFYFILVIGS